MNLSLKQKEYGNCFFHLICQKNTKGFNSIKYVVTRNVPSGIDRKTFNKWRSNYWKNRANDFK
ncbi:MAG: hypothetical protein E7153_07440 [Enterococcus faecium]|uniref:HNH/ENDO VII family nuclease n=1 Tax=Enterococcus mundtii TaxID=53346 RepID=UPI000D3908B6|nr:hypothetical protein [Enterococcus faecium]